LLTFTCCQYLLINYFQALNSYASCYYYKSAASTVSIAYILTIILSYCSCSYVPFTLDKFSCFCCHLNLSCVYQEGLAIVSKKRLEYNVIQQKVEKLRSSLEYFHNNKADISCQSVTRSAEEQSNMRNLNRIIHRQQGVLVYDLLLNLLYIYLCRSVSASTDLDFLS
jgi:hypothetical protein